MKKMLITIIGIIVLIAACEEEEEGPDFSEPFLTEKYFFRGNGTATGFIDFSVNRGTLQAGSSGVDTIYDIKYSDHKNWEAYSVEFRRKGDYNQTFHGWVSFDKSQITGYYEYMNERLPFTATLGDVITYSAEEQSDLNGEWNLRCNGGSYGILFIDHNSGYEQLGSTKEDISIVESKTTGSLGAIELVFEYISNEDRKYYGWVSSDKKQMSGFYIFKGKEEPFYAYKK